jgi:large subunit ribosomal protein L23
MTLTAHEILVRPVISEKNTLLNEQGRYVFIVDDRANKIMVRQAVEELFNVKVTAVNVMWTAAKRKRNPRSRTVGMTRTRKKAVVTLAPGERIPLFEGV